MILGRGPAIPTISASRKRLPPPFPSFDLSPQEDYASDSTSLPTFRFMFHPLQAHMFDHYFAIPYQTSQKSTTAVHNCI